MRVFWCHRDNDPFEQAIAALPVSRCADDAITVNDALGCFQAGHHQIVVDHRSGAWCAADFDLNSVLIGSDLKAFAEANQGLAQLLTHRNALGAAGQPRSYPATIKTENGHNLRRSFLFVVETTERCNLACSYCFKSATVSGTDMTPAMADRLVDYIGRFEHPDITVEFTGGEPTLNLPVIERICTGLSRRNDRIAFTLQTNASRVTPAFVDLAQRRRIRVGVSLEGSRACLDRLRPLAGGQRSADRIVGGIRTLSEAGLLAGAVAVFNAAVPTDPAEFLDLLEECGIASVKCNLFVPLGRGASSGRDLEAGNERYLHHMQAIVEGGLSRKPTIREGNTFHIVDRILGRIPTYRCMNAPCDAGLTFQMIRPNGDIFACDRYSTCSDLKLGTIDGVADSAGPFAAVPGEDVARRLAEGNAMCSALNARTVFSVPDCARCDIKAFCGGGCGMDSHHAHGGFDKPAKTCTFLKSYIPWVFEKVLEDGDFRDAYAGKLTWREARLHGTSPSLSPVRTQNKESDDAREQCSIHDRRHDPRSRRCEAIPR